jgi:ribosomal protein S18 acetylase RimI-like enzyme
MELEIRGGTAGDVKELRSFSIKAFRDTFAAMNTPENMKLYIKRAFSVGKLRAEVADENTSFYLLIADGELAGYIKLNESGSQTDINDPQSLEIERIYISKERKGQGLGSVLMDRAMGEARRRGKAYVWLGVWELNKNAIKFYEKHGFYASGTHEFMLGDDVQTDVIMRRDIYPQQI